MALNTPLVDIRAISEIQLRVAISMKAQENVTNGATYVYSLYAKRI